MKKIIVSLFVIFSSLFFTACTNDVEVKVVDNNQKEDVAWISIQESCVQNGWTWLSDFDECEYIWADWCEKENGLFNECWSACRNDPEAEICTLQCVPFCKFNISPKMHGSWDLDWDGINDCEKDWTCDHTIDYTKPRK